ncbi:MAG: DMT family transporter [Defluviitaleaceae bacterium]|nr:DMT family transporter [Defluviitaleaceae bacterium]
MPLSKERQATILLIIAALIWGGGFVAQRVAMDYMGPFTFNAVRFGLGGLSLIPVVMIMEKGGISKITLAAGLAAGTVLFAAAALQQWGIMTVGSASKAGFITGLYIVLVPILGMLVGRKTSKYVWIGAAVATIGLYLISAPDGLTAIDIGSIALLAGAFGWAIHILVIDRFVERIKPLGFSVVQCLVCSVFSFGAAFAFEDVQMSQIAAGYLPVLFSAFVSVCIAYTLQIVGQRHVPPGRSAIIFSTESIFGAIGEATLLGTFLDGRGYLGGGFIFAGILISQMQKRLKKVGNKS